MTNKTDFIERLRTLVQKGDEVDRSYAIRALADLKDSGSVELLFERLHDEDLDVSIDAVNALGELEGEGIADKLIESFLKDPEGEIKVACLESLAKLGDKKAIPHFLAVAEKPPEEVSFESGDWDLWWDMQLQSIRGLGKLKVTEAIPVLKRLIESDDYLDIENEIFNTIVDIGGKESDEYLLSLLTGNNARIKRRVAKALGRSQSKSTLKLLGRSLQDKDPDVREATLLALQERDVSQYLPAILLLFRDSNANIRKVAVAVAQKLSLSNVKEDEVADLIEKLRPVLHDSDQTVKKTVLNALQSLNWKADEEETEYLSESLKTCKGDCFTALCQVISAQNLAQGYATLLYLLRHNELEQEENIHALAAIGTSAQWNDAVESTLGALIFADTSVVRLAALEALASLDKTFPKGSSYEGRLPIEMISETMQGKLKPPASQRIIPIVPVEDIEKKFDQEAQTEVADDNSDKDQSDSEKVDTSFVDNALEQISQSIADGEKPHPMSTLDAIAITHVEDELERVAAENKKQPEAEASDEDLNDFIALTEQNREISKWLFNKNAVDVNIDIQRLAARILANIGSNEALPYLLKAFQTNDDQLKEEAALSIASLIKTANLEIDEDLTLKADLLSALNKELDSEERDLRIAAARALAEIGTIDEIPELIKKLHDDEVAMRIQVLHSLSKIACRTEDDEDTDKKINYVALAELMLAQLKTNETGVHRAAVDALIPLFGNKLNGSTVSLKQTAISQLIQAGLSGTHGQVQEMTQGLIALDKELSSIRLLEKIDEVSNSVERRYMVEMLGEIHKHA